MRLQRLCMTWSLLLAGLIAAAGAWAEPVSEGCLQALDREQRPLGYCPLEHTDVAVEVSGFIARVTLTQQFGNPYPDPIEAVYTFPMSDRAAVDQMTMRIGERVIKGVVKEKEEARRLYERARQAGQAASLLDQERPNLFTQSVANILPGARIEISISYVEYLKYEEGSYEFSFPMTVGPRYIPGAPAGQGTSQVPDANRITPPVTPEGTRAGHDIALALMLDAGLPIQNIRSELHKVNIVRPSENKAIVRLTNDKEIPNRDFVLRYGVAGGSIADAVITHADEKGKFFTLVLQPPSSVSPEEATPKEMIFVIDCSGSMRGFPIEKAKSTMRMCIEQMNPRDSFNLISFSGGAGQCFDQSMPNSAGNRAKALEYLLELEGSGGTEMMNAVRKALAGPFPEDRLRVVCFMTDGFIGNDMEIIHEIQKTSGAARVFSFGIGNSVNRFLIENMARAGRGASEVVLLDSKGDEAAKRFHQRTHRPVLTDITLDTGGLDLQQVLPEPNAIPDLFSAQPLVLTGRYERGGEGEVVLRGHTARGPFERRIRVSLPERQPEHDVLAALWARAKIDAVMARDWIGIQQGQPDSSVKSEVTRLGIDFSLVTQFTSFVAIEEKVINDGGQTRRVEVPIEMADGVSYDGIYGTGALKHAAKGVVPACAAPAAGVMRESMAEMEARPSSSPMMADAPAQREEKDKLELPKAAPESLSKLDAALQGLTAKVVNGRYESGSVKVRDGWLEVVVRAEGITEARLEELRAMGIKVVSVSRSSNRILVRVRVEDLEKAASLAWIQRIEASQS